MKRFGEILLSLIVVGLIGWGITWVYKNEKSKVHTNLAKRISELSPKGGLPRGIDDLKTAIALYEHQIELNVQEGAQTGAYWKILGIRQADKGMHRDAINSFERAVYYNAEDASLFYLTGESASIVAASAVGFSTGHASESTHFTNLAEASYLRAIDIDGAYGKPRLGLGILYTFDLNRPEDAIPHLERYLELTTNDIRGMFVLARALYMTEKYDRAVELYDRIISRTKDQKIRAEAQNNKNTIRDEMYE